jgi:DNA-binding transcriptional ArsR family regulator
VTRDSASSVFAALADPTRRALVETIARNGAATASQLSTAFPISRQAVTKHLAALSDAGLLSTQRVGREQRYVLEPVGLDAATRWMASVGSLWDDRLAALKEHLASAPRP